MDDYVNPSGKKNIAKWNDAIFKNVCVLHKNLNGKVPSCTVNKEYFAHFICENETYSELKM